MNTNLDRRTLLARAMAATVGLACLAGPSGAHGQVPTYDLRFITEGWPAAVNNHGEIVGTGFTSPNRAWFSDAEGNAIDLPVPPGAAQTKAEDINDSGLVVGTATFADGTPNACVWSRVDGEWQVEYLPTPPISFGSYGTAVNDLGDVVGSNIGTLGSHSVLFTDPDGPIDLYDLGLTSHPPVAVNNERQVAAGQFVLDLDDLTLVDIGVPDGGYLWSDARAMNDAGQVAARTVTASGSFYPVASKWDPGTGWQVLSAPVTGNTSHDIDAAGNVLIHIQSSWGQQPYLVLDGVGAYRVQSLFRAGLESWFVENIGAMAMNDQLQLAVVVENIGTGESGTALLTPLGSSADVNGDGIVDTSDLLAVLAAWGDCAGCPEDINGDGTVDIADLLIVLGSWGSVA